MKFHRIKFIFLILLIAAVASGYVVKDTTGSVDIYTGSNTTPGLSISTGNIATFGAAVALKACAKSANYTITDSDGCNIILVTTSSSAITITLPSASTNSGRSIAITKVDSGTGNVPISGTINGSTSNNTIKAQYGTGTVVSNGSAWYWLKDIEEDGSFTPALNADGTNFTTVTYITNGQMGRYSRRGRSVTASILLSWTNTSGSPSGNIYVSALPFVYSNIPVLRPTFSVIASTINFDAGYTQIMAFIPPNGDSLFLVQQGDNVSLTNVGFASVSGAVARELYLGGTYRID